MVRRLDDFSESVKRRGRMVEKRKKRTGRLGESYITTDSDWIRSVAEEVATAMQDMDWRDNLDSSYDTYDEAWDAYVDQIQAQLESDPQSVIDWLDDEEGSGVNDDLIRKIVRCFMKESKLRKHGRRMAESRRNSVDGYAVEVRDMGRALVHLLLFNTVDEAEGAYETLCNIEHWADEGVDDDGNEYDEDLYDADIEAVFNWATELTDPIRADWDVDKDGIWESYDGSRYKVINDGAYVDLWLYL